MVISGVRDGKFYQLPLEKEDTAAEFPILCKQYMSILKNKPEDFHLFA